MNFKTYNDLTNSIVSNLYKIPRDVDLVIGIPRSGTMVANIISLYLNLPFMSINEYVNGLEIKTGTTRKCVNWIKTVNEAKHILVVDDSISSGKAMNEAKEYLAKYGNEYGNECKFSYLAVYSLGMTRHCADIVFEICEQPRMFEWNFMHHWTLEYCCMDIDGVLCVDPTRVQNDDGVRYSEFVRSATPKFLPTQKVGRIVTTRLEKYREETEIWLQKNNIVYDELIMLDGVSASERRMLDMHASFKADIYKKCDAIMFFESDYGQALEICKLSGKPVFCVDNMTLIDSDNVLQKLKVHNKEIGVTIKRIVKKLTKRLNYIK